MKIVKSERASYEKNKFNAYIVFGISDINFSFKKKLKKTISDILKTYDQSNKKNYYKRSAIFVSNSSDFEFNNEILIAIQNSYLYNSWIAEGVKTETQIYKQFGYLIKQKINIKQELMLAFNKKYFSKKPGITNNQNINFVIIDNCLKTLKDYKMFFNEIYDFNRVFLKYSNYMFIALKLTESQNLSFKTASPWSTFSEKLNYEDFHNEFDMICLLNRSRFGIFCNNNGSGDDLGIHISIRYWSNKVCYHNYRPALNIEIHNNTKQTIRSFGCTLARSFERNNQNDSLRKSISDFSDTGNLHGYTIYIEYLRKHIEIEIYYVKKQLYTFNRFNTMYMVEVYICFCVDSSLYYRMSYDYLMYKTDMQVDNESPKRAKLIYNQVNEQHLKVESLINAIKSILNKSFLYYDMNKSLGNLIWFCNYHIDYCKEIHSEKVLIPWKYNETENFIHKIISNIKNNFKTRISFTLYSFNIIIGFFESIINNKRIRLMNYINNLKYVKKLHINYSLNDLDKTQNYCLQVCFHEKAYNQYYYVFLPNIDFRITKKNLKTFYRLLSNAKDNINFFLKPVLPFYNCFIDEIIKLGEMPVAIILCYHLKIQNELFDYFLYIVFVIRARNYAFYKQTFRALSSDELTYINSLTIPRLYNTIEIDKNEIYYKIISDACYFSSIRCIKNVLSACSKQAALLHANICNKARSQYCYFQSGGVYKTVNKSRALLRCLN
ncbi:hypothetical protein COBT_002298 [Conglomerata obtusa]